MVIDLPTLRALWRQDWQLIKRGVQPEFLIPKRDKPQYKRPRNRTKEEQSALLAILAEAYARGDKLAYIAATHHVSNATIKRAREAYNLPKRS